MARFENGARVRVSGFGMGNAEKSWITAMGATVCVIQFDSGPNVAVMAVNIERVYVDPATVDQAETEHYRALGI